MSSLTVVSVSRLSSAVISTAFPASSTIFQHTTYVAAEGRPRLDVPLRRIGHHMPSGVPSRHSRRLGRLWRRLGEAMAHGAAAPTLPPALTPLLHACSDSDAGETKHSAFRTPGAFPEVDERLASDNRVRSSSTGAHTNVDSDSELL